LDAVLPQVIAGQWLFGSLTCDIFNANDVLFSTASLLHLCCISWDRYIAVTDPFNYERRMTRRRAALTLAGVWAASGCLSHIPIHLGLYTTPSQRDKLAADSNECSFKVCLPAPFVSNIVQGTNSSQWYIYGYRTLRPQDTSAPGPKCPDTSAPILWFRSVLVPKCLVAEVSGSHMLTAMTEIRDVTCLMGMGITQCYLLPDTSERVPL